MTSEVLLLIGAKVKEGWSWEVPQYPLLAWTLSQIGKLYFLLQEGSKINLCLSHSSRSLHRTERRIQ